MPSQYHVSPAVIVSLSSLVLNVEDDIHLVRAPEIFASSSESLSFGF